MKSAATAVLGLEPGRQGSGGAKGPIAIAQHQAETAIEWTRDIGPAVLIEVGNDRRDQVWVLGSLHERAVGLIQENVQLRSGDRDIDPAILVEVAHAHDIRMARDRNVDRSGELSIPHSGEQGKGRRGGTRTGHEQVRLAVVIEVGRDERGESIVCGVNGRRDQGCVAASQQQDGVTRIGIGNQ